MTYDEAVTRQTIEMIWDLWRKRPGTIVVPGHDLPMIIEAGVPTYIGTREAAIDACLSDGLEQTTRFQIAVDAA